MIRIYQNSIDLRTSLTCWSSRGWPRGTLTFDGKEFSYMHQDAYSVVVNIFDIVEFSIDMKQAERAIKHTFVSHITDACIRTGREDISVILPIQDMKFDPAPPYYYKMSMRLGMLCIPDMMHHCLVPDECLVLWIPHECKYISDLERYIQSVDSITDIMES